MDRQEFLMHHGIKGMKCGRRKAVDGSSSSPNATSSDDLDVNAKDQAAKRLARRHSAATLDGIGVFVVANKAGANPVISMASGVTLAMVLARPRKSDRDNGLK